MVLARVFCVKFARYIEEYYLTGYASTSRFLMSFIGICYRVSYSSTGHFPWLRVLQEITRLGVTLDCAQLCTHHMFLITRPFDKHSLAQNFGWRELNGPGGFALDTCSQCSLWLG